MPSFNTGEKVQAIWPDDGAYYPGTVSKTGLKEITVKWDACGSTSRIPVADVKRSSGITVTRAEVGIITKARAKQIDPVFVADIEAAGDKLFNYRPSDGTDEFFVDRGNFKTGDLLLTYEPGDGQQVKGFRLVRVTSRKMSFTGDYQCRVSDGEWTWRPSRPLKQLA